MAKTKDKITEYLDNNRISLSKRDIAQYFVTQLKAIVFTMEADDDLFLINNEIICVVRENSKFCPISEIPVILALNQYEIHEAWIILISKDNYHINKVLI